MRILLSLDPGITTGYCLGRMNGDTCELAYNEAKLQPADLLLMLQDIEPEVIVYEDFQYRNRSRDKLVLFSVQLIGIVEAYRVLAPDCHVKKQTPAQGKGHYSDDALRRHGLYQKGGEGHGRDAARHLLQYMTFGAGWQLFNGSAPQFKMVDYSVFGV
jgi:hypothetical protein